jgi:PAS domain S-box-containing protein
MEQNLLQYILDISRHMAETRDLALLLDRVMDEAIRLVGAERGYMVLVQPGGVLDFRVQRGPDGEVLEDAKDQVSRSILSQVVDTGQPLVLRDATQDPHFGAAESVVILGLRSIMCVPLVSRGDTIGAIYVENRSIRGRFRQEDAIPLVLFANQAAVAIENARLFQNLQKAHDELETRVEERTAELSEANALLIQEIAERNRAEKAQQASEEKFSKAFRSSPDSITITTLKDGRYIEVNDSFLGITGYSHQEVIGRTAAELKLWGRPTEREKLLQALQEQGMVRDLEVCVRGRSGELGVVSMSAEIIELDGEECLLAVSRDITERKRMEESIQRLYEQTRRDAEAKTTLLREVNHRVKNNLTSIIGLIQTEQRYAAEKDRDAVQAAMERLISRINGLAQVHDILSHSEWSAVPLSELALHIMSAARDTVPLDRLVSMEVTPSPVRISPRQASNLALVINELVTNTLKHASSGNTVTSIFLHIDLEDDNTVFLEYRDDGPGYPEDVLRLERHGVGLYLIRSLVSHALRGSLSLANDGGSVTTIRFQVEEKDTT